MNAAFKAQACCKPSFELHREPSPSLICMLQCQLVSRTRAKYVIRFDARRARARIQSEMLISDIAAFKAANPGSCLADFIRWHSPRDYSTEAGLSARMRNPDSLWAELWKGTKAQQATRQKPLLDYRREGEKALHFLETAISPGSLFAQLAAAAYASVGQLLAQCPSAKERPLPELERLADVLDTSAR